MGNTINWGIFKREPRLKVGDEEVAPLLGGHGSESPIIEDQKLDARQALEEPSVMAVAACKRERLSFPQW